MRLRRSWNVAVVFVAVLLMVTLQVAGAAQAPATLNGLAAGALPNTVALDPEGGAAGWATLVVLVFLVIANLLAFGGRSPWPASPPAGDA